MNIKLEADRLRHNLKLVEVIAKVVGGIGTLYGLLILLELLNYLRL